MKHDRMAAANATATMVAGLYVVCRFLVWLVPDWMFAMGQSWFHGIELTRMETVDLTLNGFLFGLVSSTIVAWMIGWCFAHCYNYFLARGKN